MSTTKNRTKATNATTSQPVPDCGTGQEVLTLAEAAGYLRLSEEDIVRLVVDEGFPGRRLGQEWRFLKAALQDWLRAPQPSLKSREVLMQWAGAFKDDPDLKEIVREAYQQRGRPLTEDGE